MEGWRKGGRMEGGGREGGGMEGWREDGGSGEGWRKGGRMEEGGKDGGRGEAEREEGVRQGATSGRQFWALVAVRGGGCWAGRLHRSRRPSSSFVVVLRHSPLSSSFSNVVRRRHSSMLVGGVGRLRAVVAVFNRAWSFSIERVVVCVCGHPSSFVGGWSGRSSSPVGFPRLWAVVP